MDPHAETNQPSQKYPFDHFFQKKKINIDFSRLNILRKIHWSNLYAKQSYLLTRKDKNEIDHEWSPFSALDGTKNDTGLFSIDGNWRIMFVNDPSPKEVAKIIWKEIFPKNTRITFSHEGLYYVLSSNGVYRQLDKKGDVITLYRDTIWKMDITSALFEQKNVSENDFSYYITQIKDLSNRNFVTEIAEYLVTNVPNLSDQEFNKILQWQEGKIIYFSKVVDLKKKTTSLLENSTDLQGVCSTNTEYPVFNQFKVKFLIKQIVLTYGREHVNRFISFLLKALTGRLKESKLLGVASGARHSGSTTLHNSLKTGLGNVVSTKNGENLLFKTGSSGKELAREYAVFRKLYALLYIVTEFKSHPVNSDNIKKLSGNESFDARGLWKDESTIPYFLPGIFFNGNTILNVQEADIRSTFVTFRRSRILVPSKEKKIYYLNLGFPKRMLRFQKPATVKKLKNMDYCGQWIHVIELFQRYKTVFCGSNKLQNNSSPSTIGKRKREFKKRYPALQNTVRDSDYWNLRNLDYQLRYVISNHFLITEHPQDFVEFNTLREILENLCFSKIVPTFGQWEKFLRENYQFPDKLVGPSTPNLGGPANPLEKIKPFETFCRLVLKEEEKGQTKPYIIRGLRLLNAKNGFDDSSFHSESFALGQEGLYKKEKCLYEARRLEKIENFRKKFKYVPPVFQEMDHV